MSHSNYININDNINSKVYSNIINILKEYSIEPLKIEKVRSVYKIICEDKIYCLKRMKHGGEDKVQKGILLAEYLKSNGFLNVVRYIKTNQNKISVRKGHHVYYLMDYIKGRESNFDDYEELKKCCELLGNFHLKSKGLIIDNSKIQNNTKNWPAIFKNERNDLEIVRDIIKNKKVKTSFDLKYYSLIDEHINQMLTSMKLLDDSHYLEFSSKANIERTVCHDSFYYQNILVKNNDKMYIIDLDSALYDLHVYDLGKFLRRILYRKNYVWNFEIAKELIEIYCSINKLTKEEYPILLAFIMFPHKYWKLGQKRYIKKKKWVEDKYARKLNNLIKYKEKQNEFVNNFYDYYIKDDSIKIDEKKEE